MTPRHGRSIGVLIVSNLLGGVGVASGFAVGGLLAQSLGGTSMAGFAQACSTLGAAVAAVPLANLAGRRGRRVSLSRGYAVACLGAVVIITAAVSSQIILMLLGMSLFGVAQAVNLQTRYAGAENVSPAARARAMSIVLWATTIGAVTGPNLAGPGDRFGAGLSLPAFTGPFLFSAVAFATAATVLAVLFRPSPAPPTGASAVEEPDALPSVGAVAALRWATGHPAALFAVVLIAVAHAVMVMVMVMTPVHMGNHGDTLELVGIVISLHVLGMYALSPVFGWAVDRLGAIPVAIVGIVLLAGAVCTGFVAASAGPGLTMMALVLLGLGWSASVISGSSLVSSLAPGHIRVALQGATDAGMNYAGAASAALAGPILAFGEFQAVNVAAALILLPAVVFLPAALRSVRSAVPAAHQPIPE
ncbi:MFS transporter [Tessaracoccus antarcticus]|uniref:MFS transporter n=1 Tax=Tessaracoccus antarcticus TaxID=2479848 RepID=A0A3M0GBD2_9ACTN|nr:MFS transporter [Tessaracoccus antarcticus]RMB61688.1 MFS transporter [Tessaracoccus antarcticus]